MAPVTWVRPGEHYAAQVSRDRALTAVHAADASSTGLPVGVQLAALPWRGKTS